MLKLLAILLRVIPQEEIYVSIQVIIKKGCLNTPTVIVNAIGLRSFAEGHVAIIYEKQIFPKLVFAVTNGPAYINIQETVVVDIYHGCPKAPELGH